MRTLVTGLSGFVGSHCAQQLQAVGLELQGRPVDLREPADVAAAVRAAAPEAVLHLAARSSVAQSFEDPRATCETNFLGTLTLLQALAAAGFTGRLLYVSSGEVYGSVDEAALPVGEAQPLRPRNPYAVSKVAAEALCYQWSQTGPFEVVVARPFNHVGPGQDARFAVADFARQVQRIRAGLAKPELTVGDVDVTRDFTDVRDVVRAYRLLLERGRNGVAYNVCCGVERSLREVVQALAAAAGVTLRIAVDPQRLRPAEQRRMCGDFGRLRDATGWQPAIPFERTVADILDHIESESAQ